MDRVKQTELLKLDEKKKKKLDQRLTEKEHNKERHHSLTSSN